MDELNSRDARNRANNKWHYGKHRANGRRHYGNNSRWSDDTDEHGRDQQAIETSGVQGQAIDTLAADTIASPIVDEVLLKAQSFQRDVGAQNKLMAPGRTADVEAMVVTTFQNGEGLDVEVYARLEGRAFLFRREPETEDKKIQIRGWPLSGDPSLVEYTNAMRLHYFMSTEEPRRATYLAEIGEEEEGSKGDLIIDEDDLLRVIMPFDVSRQLRDDGERDRLPSPVVRALFGEPPVKLRRKRLSLREPGSVPDIELCPWVLYERKGFPRRWSAKRHNILCIHPLKPR